MSQLGGNNQLVGKSDWNNCHIDHWFVIAKYLRPEDTLIFAQICKKTYAVTNSESFWRSIFNRYIRSKYPWVDIPSSSPGSSKKLVINLLTLFCQRLGFHFRHSRPDDSGAV